MHKLWPSALTYICVTYVLITGPFRAKWTSKYIKLHFESMHNYLCAGNHQFGGFRRGIAPTERASKRPFAFRFHVTDSLHRNQYLSSLRWRKMTVMMTSLNGNVFRVMGPLWGNPSVTSRFSPQRPVTRGFNIFFALRLNKRLRKWSRRLWFETS